MCPQNCKIGHFTSWIGQEQLRNVQTMKKAPARLAKFLASVVEYANARRPFNLRRLGCFTRELKQTRRRRKRERQMKM